MLNLGVNIDHVATVRQARLALEPCPVEAALICEKAGAWGITAHLREDRRHVNDKDIEQIAEKVKRLNFEMAITEEMLKIAKRIKPYSSCLVPEKREELTTEGGLEVAGQMNKVTEAVKRLKGEGIIVSLFLDPDEKQVDAAKKSGADYIELHTGTFANSSGDKQQKELERLINAAKQAHDLGLKVNAGHGIDYVNIEGILQIPHLKELNIGHSIVSHSIFVGIGQAVKEMLKLMSAYKKD